MYKTLHLLFVVQFSFVCKGCPFFFVCGSLQAQLQGNTHTTLCEFVFLKGKEIK